MSISREESLNLTKRWWLCITKLVDVNVIESVGHNSDGELLNVPEKWIE